MDIDLDHNKGKSPHTLQFVWASNAATFFGFELSYGSGETCDVKDKDECSSLPYCTILFLNSSRESEDYF